MIEAIGEATPIPAGAIVFSDLILHIIVYAGDEIIDCLSCFDVDLVCIEPAHAFQLAEESVVRVVV